ncbi:hypothetical protein B0P06_001743 [Clostridium saccharoperbutylacetonicum]|nr:hypothetical protein [Clostridium saccharoperbutylacetonicum]NSB41972.1 hypothetical protein [Clostridium saccharoperbutylacetonicum]
MQIVQLCITDLSEVIVTLLNSIEDEGLNIRRFTTLDKSKKEDTSKV